MRAVGMKDTGSEDRAWVGLVVGWWGRLTRWGAIDAAFRRAPISDPTPVELIIQPILSPMTCRLSIVRIYASTEVLSFYFHFRTSRDSYYFNLGLLIFTTLLAVSPRNRCCKK